MGLQDIALMNIESKAKWVREDATGLAHYVKMLVSLPGFETRAEDEVNKAETALTEALLAVKLERSKLEKKRSRALQAAE